jgi:hypothetical protein
VNRTVRRGARLSNTRGCPGPPLRLLTSTEIARVLREAAKPAGVCGCGEGLHRGHRFCSRCGRRARRPDADRAWSKLYSALELADCSVQHLGRVNGPGRVDEFRHCPVCGVRLTYPGARDPSTASGAGLTWGPPCPRPARGRRARAGGSVDGSIPRRGFRRGSRMLTRVRTLVAIGLMVWAIEGSVAGGEAQPGHASKPDGAGQVHRPGAPRHAHQSARPHGEAGSGSRWKPALARRGSAWLAPPDPTGRSERRPRGLRQARVLQVPRDLRRTVLRHLEGDW